jgi:glycosyltransferase involved in cell wall biosynthesis
MDRVAVLIPVYNDPVGLEATLASLQAHPEDLEVVVVDDSQPHLNIPLQVGPHPVKVLQFEQRQGFVKALNLGLEYILQQGYTYIARLDAADIPLPGRFGKQLKAFRQNPRLGLLGTYTEFVDPVGKLLYTWRPPTDEPQLRRFLHLQNAFVHSSVMYTSQVIRKVGFYREGYPAAEDYELFFRISSKFEVGMLGEVLMRCDLDPDGISVKSRRNQLRSAFRVRLEHFDPLLKESYTGLVRGALSSVLPFALVNRIKERMWG